MDRSRVAIVIPALNESLTIASVVEAVSQYGTAIVVDDGSTDGTALLALRAGALVVSHKKNRGYDAALNTGFEKAATSGMGIIITMDADGQHDPSLIQRFIDAIDSGADVVAGIRNRRQRMAEHIFAWYTRLRFDLRDPLCGMKAYRIDVYTKLGYFDSYGSVGTQLIIFAAMRNFRVEQIQLNIRKRQGSSRFGQVISGNLKILRAMLLSVKLK